MDRDLGRLLVHVDSSILEAMSIIDAGHLGLALVHGSNGAVVGSLSDGDLRRALLGGKTLQSKCLREAMNADFVRASADMGRSEILDLMIARDIRHVPVLDEQGRLVGLHLLRELLGAGARPNWAVLMAGGEGQRLRPLTEQIPKPMVRVAGRPVLERLVLHLVGWGVRRIFLSVNYLATVIEDHFGDGAAFGCEIEYLHENQPLGTGGALALLPNPPTSPILVMNGDLITQVNIGQLLRHHDVGGYMGTIGVHSHSIEIPYGVVQTTDRGVEALVEKPIERRLVNAGVYVLSPELVQRVPADRNYPITQLLQGALDRNEPVGAFAIEDDWIDVGNHRDLERARGNA